jgi:putative membrane protein
MAKGGRYGKMMSGDLVIGLLVLVLLLLVVGGGIAVVVWFMVQASQGTGPRSRPQREDEALAILRRRYARGEIDREEFERMREELRS